MTAGGPKVLEYNARFGDPECEVLMMRFDSDLLPYLMACSKGNLDELEAPDWDPRPACCVILASGGYPGDYQKGIRITGIEDVEEGPDLQVFHAGTTMKDGELVTNGGRVLAVTARGENLAEARRMAYEAVDKIHFEGKTYRTDIGLSAERALERMQ